jgi:hypothetical protein
LLYVNCKFCGNLPFVKHTLENHNVTGLLTISQDIENIMNVYINIFLLLYADDTVLMTETPEDLQKQLNIVDMK